MAKGRKARRNTLARVTETGQRPAAAYRELRTANAPYEGYVVDLFHVPGAFEDGRHRGDSWGYRVCDPGGRPLSWGDVNGPDHSHLTTRQACTLLGKWPLEWAALQARFPGARVNEHDSMPAGCHCDLVACWSVHRGCTVECEHLRTGAEFEANWAAEEAYHAAYAVWQAEHTALDERHDTENAELERAGQAVRKRVDAWCATVNAGVLVSDSESLWRDEDAFRQRERDQRERHQRERADVDARRPAMPAHWTLAHA